MVRRARSWTGIVLDAIAVLSRREVSVVQHTEVGVRPTWVQDVFVQREALRGSYVAYAVVETTREVVPVGILPDGQRFAGIASSVVVNWAEVPGPQGIALP